MKHPGPQVRGFITPTQGLRHGLLTQAVGLGFVMSPLWG